MCLLICLFPARSQPTHRPSVSGRHSEALRTTAPGRERSPGQQRKSVPNKKHVSFIESDDAKLTAPSERKLTPNKRHRSHVEPNTEPETKPARSADAPVAGTNSHRRPLHNSYVMVRKAQADSSGDSSSYSRESAEEKLSTERMTRFATNMNYTSALNKFIEYQERDFLDTVKVGDPNVRPIGGSFGCKIPSGSY